MGLVSGLVVFSQSFWVRVLPGGALLIQPRCVAERILRGGQRCGISFWPFLNSSGWWWLISSVFLTRISCHKTTHVNGYYGAWPGWEVSVSVLPLTRLLHSACLCSVWLLMSLFLTMNIYLFNMQVVYSGHIYLFKESLCERSFFLSFFLDLYVCDCAGSYVLPHMGSSVFLVACGFF